MAENLVLVVRMVVLSVIQRKNHVVRLGWGDDVHDVPIVVVVVVRSHQNRRVWDDILPDLVVVTNRGLKSVFKVVFNFHGHTIVTKRAFVVTGRIDGTFVVTKRFRCGSGTHQILNRERLWDGVRVTVVTLLGEVYKGEESCVNHVERLGGSGELRAESCKSVCVSLGRDNIHLLHQVVGSILELIISCYKTRGLRKGRCQNSTFLEKLDAKRYNKKGGLGECCFWVFGFVFFWVLFNDGDGSGGSNSPEASGISPQPPRTWGHNHGRFLGICSSSRCLLHESRHSPGCADASPAREHGGRGCANACGC